jgi:hypothetical protein
MTKKEVFKNSPEGYHHRRGYFNHIPLFILPYYQDQDKKSYRVCSSGG